MNYVPFVRHPDAAFDVTIRIGSTQSMEAFKQTTNGSPLKGVSERYIGTKRLQPKRIWRTRPE